MLQQRYNKSCKSLPYLQSVVLMGKHLPLRGAEYLGVERRDPDLVETLDFLRGAQQSPQICASIAHMGRRGRYESFVGPYGERDLELPATVHNTESATTETINSASEK